jgi:hypothetical protein
MKVRNRTSMGRVRARSTIVALVVTVAALIGSSAAYAAGSAQQTYGGTGGNVQSGVQAGANHDPRDSQSTARAPSGLPFTGLDLTLMLGGGLVLLGSGVALSRLVVSRKQI